MNGMNISSETLLRFEETIRHFRGYIDKERLEDDINYLQDFLREIESMEHSAAEQSSQTSPKAA